ncbi:DUF3617 domain-containing protein [Comamonas humi]
MKKLGMCALAAWALSCAAAQPMPARKPGLWEVAIAGGQGAASRPVTVQQCTDRASDAQVLLSIVPGQEHCDAPTVHRQGRRYRIENQCAVHGRRLNLQMELSGDLGARYEGSYEVLPERTAGGPPAEARRFEARWLGECRAGMQPGDMVLPNGITVQVLKQPHGSVHADGHHHD